MCAGMQQRRLPKKSVIHLNSSKTLFFSESMEFKYEFVMFNMHKNRRCERNWALTNKRRVMVFKKKNLNKEKNRVRM